jgi:SAM-dependent methyltransferase
MYGRYQKLLYRSPLKRFVYGIIGWPRVADWNRFWRVLRAVDELGVAPSSILDAGCGNGFYTMALAERFPQAAITAADDEQHLVENLRRSSGLGGFPNITPVQADLAEFTPGQQFDLICCVDVLEHIDDDNRALASFARWLRPGGFLILHVPQRFQKFQFIKRSLDPTGPHRREGYTPQEISALLESHGLHPVRSERSYGSLAGLAVELDELLWQNRLYPVWLVWYPLLLAVMKWDTQRPVTRGYGVLITAQRDG